MKKVISLIIIFSLFLVGCKNDNMVINYEGNSESWYVSYKIEGSEKTHDSYYIIKFIGTDNKTESEIKYHIDGPKEGEEGKFSLGNNNEYTGKIKMTGGIPSSSDRDIRVTIEWNGQKETALLKRSK